MADALNVESKSSSDEPPVPPEKILGLVKHDPKKIYSLGETKFLFKFPLSSLMMITFIFGWIDQDSYVRFGIMSTMQTANIIFLTINCFPANNSYYELVTSIPLLMTNFITGTVFGPWFCLFSLEFTQSREKAYAIIVTFLCINCLIVDLISAAYFREPSQSSPMNYLVLLLALPGTALFHWSLKLGYILNFQTGNAMRLSDSLYLWSRGYKQGGAIYRGDIIALILIIISYFFGSLGCSGCRFAYGDKYPFSLSTLACTWPVQLWIGGCFESLGDFSITNMMEKCVYNWTLDKNDEELIVEDLLKLKQERVNTRMSHRSAPATINRQSQSHKFSVQVLSKRHSEALLALRETNRREDMLEGYMLATNPEEIGSEKYHEFS